MLADIGIITSALALLMALYAIVAGLYGAVTHRTRWVKSARNAALLTWPLLTAACAAMIISLVNGDYQIEYVYSVTEDAASTFLKITGLWGGQAGSLLFWSWLLSTFIAGALLLNWKAERRLMPYFIVFSMITLTFFLYLNVVVENPFVRLWQYRDGEVVSTLFQPQDAFPAVPQDGRGLNALLRHFGMIIHPPMLYLGYVGLVIPWAFAMAALASGELSTNWIRASRRWTLVAWLFLSLGLILGGRWAYDVLGWGGYWGWDPVENAALLPWLTATAFLHSVMIQEKRGMLKVWNMFLIIITFLLVILGTFSTRSGIVSSVHSFAQSPIGPPMFAFMTISTIGSLILWLYRWQRGDLASEHRLQSLFSREALFIANNFVFLAITIAVFWGSYAPIFTELFIDEKITLGPPYFMSVTAPLFGVMYILMGVAPLSAWGGSSLRRMGRAMLIPLALTAAFTLLIFILGIHLWGALLGAALIMFAGFVTAYEVIRGGIARSKQQLRVLKGQDQTDDAFSIPDFMTVVFATLMLFAFFFLPWVSSIGISFTGANILSNAPEVVRLTGGPASSAFYVLVLIPFAAGLALAAGLKGIFSPMHRRLASNQAFVGGLLALVYFVALYSQGDYSTFIGIGFIVNVFASLGLIVQVLVPRKTFVPDFSRATVVTKLFMADGLFSQSVWGLFGRNRRRYGGYIIHLGVVVIGIGVIGSTLYQVETQQTLAEGESLTLGQYTMVYDQLVVGRAEDAREMVIAEVDIYRGDRYMASLRPRQDHYVSGETMTIAGNYSTIENDFYVLLVAWEEISQAGATFKVYLNPLVNFVWWGGVILMIGVVVAAWPQEERKRKNAVDRKFADSSRAVPHGTGR